MTTQTFLFFSPVGLRGHSGGAKDVNSFRENIQKNFLPTITNMSYEGVFYDYFFDTAAQEEQEKTESKNLFCPSYSMATVKDSEDETCEFYMTVGLNSNLDEATFQRNPMNLLVCIDTSGSMSSPFNRYHYDRRQPTK